jgi:23S rRNA (uracil1939-C5)-methyltransferase
MTGEAVEVSIDAIAAGGAGVGRLPEGRVVFVARTAPGDRALVRLTFTRNRWAKGELLRILEPGPGRVEPLCPHYGGCGGCALQHLEGARQLEARGKWVHDALERIGRLTDLPPVELIPAPDPFYYRNRASFTLRRLGVRGPGGAKVVAGFHALNRPDRLVDVGVDAEGACRLLEPALADLWLALRRGWGPDAQRLPSGAELRLTLRGLAEGGGILLVEGGRGPGRPEALLEAVPGLRALWSSPPPTIPGGESGAPRLLAGDPEPLESWFGESLPIRPGAFLQVNRRGAEALHSLALEALGIEPGDRVLDLYAGFGVYGRAAARAGALAIGVEQDAGAVAMGEARPVEGFELVEDAVEQALPGLLPAHRVLLNPPRGGTREGVMEALAASPPKRLVYVSCDPATLARDLQRLGPGFQLRRIQAFDLFPQTAHIETVVTLEPTNLPTRPHAS